MSEVAIPKNPSNKQELLSLPHTYFFRVKGSWLKTTLFEGTACADSRRTLADLKGRDRTSVTRSCESEMM